MFRRRSADPARRRSRPRCTAAGCRRRDVTRCSYVDRRDRACVTVWCPEHVVDVAGIAFCRRHASTMTAIEGSEMIAGMPDLDNRAASLASWVARDVDAAVRHALESVAPADGTVIAGPVAVAPSAEGASHRWVKTWRLVREHEVIRAVSVEVDEEDDTEVVARTEGELVGRGRPPWIEGRSNGRRVDPATDAVRRRDFSEAVARSIEHAVHEV